MPFFKVSYNSMTASYAPKVIEANSESEAKRKFAGNAFSSDEMGLISAKQMSSQEIMDAINRRMT